MVVITGYCVIGRMSEGKGYLEMISVEAIWMRKKEESTQHGLLKIDFIILNIVICLSRGVRLLIARNI